MFTGFANFIGAEFTGDADFGSAHFSGDATFALAQFNQNANFGSAQFSEGASFSGAQFNGSARYDGESAEPGVSDLSGWFTDARFTGPASFDGAQFTGTARFDGTQFQNATALGPLAARVLSLDRAMFGSMVVIQAAALTVSCRYVTWSAGVDLRLRYARVDPVGAKFTAPSFISGSDQLFELPGGPDATPPEWLKEPAYLVESVEFIRLSAPRSSPKDPWVPRLNSLSDCDIGNLSLTDVDLSSCRFAGAQLLDQLRLEGRCIFDHPPRGLQTGVAWPPAWRRRRRRPPGPHVKLRGRIRDLRIWIRRTCSAVLANGARSWSSRQSIAEERDWRATTRKYAGWSDFGVRSTLPATVGPDRLAGLYRQLRKAQEDAKNEPGAADFYYGEMEMRRNATATPVGERIILWLYWLISGYGLRALRSLTALLVVGVIVTTVLVGWGLAANAPPQDLTGTIISSAGNRTRIDATLNTAAPQLPPAPQRWTGQRTRTALEVTIDSIVFRTTDQPLTAAGAWITDAARILGPVLLALALLAVRGRVKR